MKADSARASSRGTPRAPPRPPRSAAGPIAGTEPGEERARPRARAPRTVASSTPAARPRQPRAPRRPPIRPRGEEDRQAVGHLITATRPRRRAIEGVRGDSGAAPTSGSSTCVPCTCSIHAGSSGRPSCSCTRRRFSRTASAASPTCRPTLSESNGGALTPPVRSVNAARTPAGAGHSGVRTSGPPPAGLIRPRVRGAR